MKNLTEVQYTWITVTKPSTTASCLLVKNKSSKNAPKFFQNTCRQIGELCIVIEACSLLPNVGASVDGGEKELCRFEIF